MAYWSSFVSPFTMDGFSQTPPVMRNFAAAETDVHYQDMHVEIDPAINKVAGVITFYFTSRVDQLNRFVVDYQDDLPILFYTERQYNSFVFKE